MEAVRADAGVAEPAQVGHDHLETGRRQRLDHAPEDALRFGPAVHEDEWDATDPFANVRLREPAARGPVNREAAGIDIGLGHGRSLAGPGGRRKNRTA